MQTETAFLSFWRSNMPTTTVQEARAAYASNQGEKYVIASLLTGESSVVMTEYHDEHEAKLAYDVMKSGPYIMLEYFPVTVH